MSVQIGVHVRPFNTRKKDNNSICIIEMNENQTIIKDELGQPRTFTFDQAFVYNALGKQILNNEWEGYHCCLFAYGQTGSGK